MHGACRNRVQLTASIHATHPWNACLPTRCHPQVFCTAAYQLTRQPGIHEQVSMSAGGTMRCRATAVLRNVGRCQKELGWYQLISPPLLLLMLPLGCRSAFGSMYGNGSSSSHRKLRRRGPHMKWSRSPLRRPVQKKAARPCSGNTACATVVSLCVCTFVHAYDYP